MSAVVVHMSVSLDGFISGPDDGPGRGLGRGGEVLHGWLADGTADPTSYRPMGDADGQAFDEMLASGAVITGRHTFEWAGEWGGDHHDGVPIFVLTRTRREPYEHALVQHLSDLPEAVASARAAAGDRDVMVHGGSSVRALLRAGLVDEFAITLVPVLLRSGKRLFDDPASDVAQLELVRSREGSGGVLHLRYRVVTSTA